MDKKIINAFITGIEDYHSLAGRSFEFSEDVVKVINENAYINNIDKLITSDDIRIGIHNEFMDRYMIVYTMSKMIKNNEIELKLTDKANESNISYLKKLCEK